MKDVKKEFYRVIYRDCNNEVYFLDYETRKDLLLNAPTEIKELIDVRKFKGETSRSVAYLFENIFEQVAK